MTTPKSTRPLIVGPDAGPEAPYPLRMEGEVISGFGRGSKELGIPTANLPVDDSVTSWISDIKSGVYFGWASLALPASHPQAAEAGAGAAEVSSQPVHANTSGNGTTTKRVVYPMVMSIGYNPFYKNTVRSAEVHILHRFDADFYGAHMRLLILGFIRDELDYSGLEALIADINLDCDVARNSLRRDAWLPVERGGRLDGSWLLSEADGGHQPLAPAPSS